MKYLFLIILYIINCTSISAQKDNSKSINSQTLLEKKSKSFNKRHLDFYHNWCYPGRSLSLQYVHYWGRHALTGGLKYHINGADKITAHSFKGKFYANPAIERIGVSVGYQFDFRRPQLPNKARINPFLFASIQYSYLGMRRSFYVKDVTTSLETKETDYYDNFFLFEYTAGFGLTVNLFKKFYLNGGTGFSLARFEPTFDPQGTTIPMYSDETVTEGGLIYRLGITYMLR